MKSKIEKYVNKVWKDNDDKLSFKVFDDFKIEDIARLEFTKKELLKYSTLLIDYLNTQPQAEEEISFADFNALRALDNKRKDFEKLEQSTPEQKEEWEEELLTLCSKAKDFDEITSFIKNLLSEREAIIVKNKGVKGGQAVFNGTRITLVQVLRYFKAGWCVKDVLLDFPQLEDYEDFLEELDNLLSSKSNGRE